MFKTYTFHDERTGMYLVIMYTMSICRNLGISFTLQYVVTRASIIRNNRYHGCVLEVKLLLYGVNRPSRLVLRLGMSRIVPLIVPLISFCACIAFYRDICTVTTACCFDATAVQLWWDGVCTSRGCMIRRFDSVVWDVSYLYGWAMKRGNYKTLKKKSTWIFYLFIGHKWEAYELPFCFMPVWKFMFWN